MTRISFNQWLSLQGTGPYRQLANSWKTGRGRITRRTVIERARCAGVDSREAAEAYDTYLAAIGGAPEATVDDSSS